MALLDLFRARPFLISTNMSFSCSRVFGSSGPLPFAQNEGYDGDGLTVDSTGSIGDDVRVVITRDGIVIETTAGEPNTGTNQIEYTVELENGDIICVQASYDNFATYATECRTIPTPGFGFVPIT